MLLEDITKAILIVIKILIRICLIYLALLLEYSTPDSLKRPFSQSQDRNGGILPSNTENLASDENQAKLFENLKYGSAITINMLDKVSQENHALCTKLRISDKLGTVKMEKDEYNINSLFKIIPSAQHNMQDKILDIIESEVIPHNIDIEYENFISEVESNTTAYNISKDKPVRFEDSFQLYQDSSKRFICFYSCKINEIKKEFKNTYSDSNWYYLGLTEYPGDNTHFSFETVPSYQQEEDGTVKKYHYLYLTIFEKGKMHYLYNLNKSIFLTESEKTPITLSVVREAGEINVKRTLGRTDVVLISFANDNFYLNIPQKINYNTGKYEDKEPEFKRWQDSKNIDFNGWWQIDVIGELSDKMQLRHYNTGNYLALAENLESEFPFDLTPDQEKARTFEVQPINSANKDINCMWESDIFKIKIELPGLSTDREYITIETWEESDYIFDEGANFNKKKIVRSTQSPTNLNDTFKFIIPKEEEYLELSLCIDSRSYIEAFIGKLKKNEDVLEKLNRFKEGLAKVLLKIMDFEQNKLRGKIRVDYGFGEIVPHRREMVAKVGILNYIFQLLSLIEGNMHTKTDVEEVLVMLEISPEDFEGFSNLLEILLKVLHLSVMNNPTNLTQWIKQMGSIQKFVFVKGCSSLLIDMFKDKSFEINKNEIHSELLYRRIFEIERFVGAIELFTSKLARERKFTYLVILRKMWIIDGNPLPLVQNLIFKKLYEEDESFRTKYDVSLSQNGQALVYVGKQEPKKEILLEDFFENSSVKEQNFLLEQLTLEADLWYGRNQESKKYFREIYPWDWLIAQIKNPGINIELRGKFIRLINYIYIDDPPHKLLKMKRAFKAYESSNKYIEEISSTRSPYLQENNLNKLIEFVKEYIEVFAKDAGGEIRHQEFSHGVCQNDKLPS
jgi:hypothetical protein